MTFTRREADNWHREVPGARWFKADLHIHTIDDLPGDRAKVPDGVGFRRPASEEAVRAYARKFLNSAVERGVRVLGLTPHSPRIGTDAGTSAVWSIVEEWNHAATGNRGRVACAGAIEEPAVRDAIVRTADGGDEAFRLRRLKYGF